MTTVIEEQPLVRVERGTLADDELAALTAVLLTRATASGTDQPADQATTPVIPLWNRLERNLPYHSPMSWQRRSRAG